MEASKLVKAYRLIKEKYPDCMPIIIDGGHCQTYEEDAERLAAILNTPLIVNSQGARVAGFNQTEIEETIPRLLKAGCRVGIVDLKEMI